MFSDSRVRPSQSRAAPRRFAVVLAAVALLLTVITPVAAGGGVGPRHTWRPAHHGQIHAPTALSSARGAAAFATAQPRHETARSGRNLPVPGLSRSRATASDGPSALGPLAPQVVVGPSLAVTKSFTGLDQADGGNVYPADPWVAVNSSYVVQVVNATVRMSDRNGNVLLSVPEWAMFLIPAGLVATDGRIIWDPVHGRWVGEVLAFSGDLSTNILTLAVSDGADPTGGWVLYPIVYSGELPDFPSIASSSTKVVLTDDLYDSGLNPIGADIITITWASILGGAGLSGWECTSAGEFVPRAAQVLSSNPDVHVITVDNATGDQLYLRIIGSGNCTTGEYTDFLDMSASFGWSAFASPPDPRQPGPNPLTGADDGRPRDAIWMNGKLWWVSTIPVSYDGGTTWNDAVAVWGANTFSTGTPTANTTYEISAGDAIDDFMGGIGLTRNGTLVVSYSESSDAANIAWYANAIPSGGSFGTPQLLGSSDGTTDQDRWGDYAAVATDPVGTGSVWATHGLIANDGSWRTGVARLLLDTDSPTNPGAPSPNALMSKVLTSTPAYRIAWTASTDAASGSVSYAVEESIDGGAWSGATSVTGTSIVRNLPLGHNYRFRVTAFDGLGHTSGTVQGPLLTPTLYQNPTSRGGTWSTQAYAGYTGSSTWYSSAAGASATFTTTGVRSIGFVTTKATSRGSFKVYIDGAYKTTISAYGTTAYRQILYQYTWASPGTHTIKIVVVGTSGHPRVDVDGFLILR